MNCFQGSFQVASVQEVQELFSFVNGDKDEEITGMTLLNDTTER